MTLTEKLRAAQLPPPWERRAIRIGAGASQRELAHELDVTPLTISRWERGDSEPRRDKAIAYRRLLDELRAVGQ